MADVTPYGAALSQSREYALPETTDWGAQMSSDVATWSADNKANKEKQEASLTDYASRVLAPSTYQMYDGAYEYNKNWAAQLSDPAYIKQMTSTTEGVIMYEQALTGLQNSIAEHTDHYVTTYGTAQDDSSMGTASGALQRDTGYNPYAAQDLQDTNGTDYYQGVLNSENNPNKYSGYQFNPQTGRMQKMDPDALDISLDQNLFKPNLSAIAPQSGGGWYQDVSAAVGVSYSDPDAAREALRIQYNKPNHQSSVAAQRDSARRFVAGLLSPSIITAEEVLGDSDMAMKAEKQWLDDAMHAYENSAGRITFLREEAEDAAAEAAALAEANAEEVERELPFSFRNSSLESINSGGFPVSTETSVSPATNDSRKFIVQLQKTTPEKGSVPEKTVSIKHLIGDVHFDPKTGQAVAFELLYDPDGLDVSFEANSTYNTRIVKRGEADFVKVYNSLNDAVESKTQISGREFLERGWREIQRQPEFYRVMSQKEKAKFNDRPAAEQISIMAAMEAISE